MPRICISYRRSDSSAIAGRIHDHLVRHYGADTVFMDLSGIPYGADFREHIEATLNDADVLLAVIGYAWLGGQDGGRPRIHDLVDPVRAEIQIALRRQILVVPLLVDGADMPGADDLPRNIREFAFRNAMRVDSGADFHLHVERLIGFIGSALGLTQTASAPARMISGSANLPSGGSRPIRMRAVGRRLLRLIPYVAVPVILLLLAHYVVIMKLDLGPTYLWLAAIFIPLACGFLAFWRTRLRLTAIIPLAIVVAVLTVAGMLATVGLVDARPILPNSAGEWQEAAEYGVGITLATVAGNLLARWAYAVAPRGRGLF
jgi:TIR domain